MRRIPLHDKQLLWHVTADATQLAHAFARLFACEQYGTLSLSQLAGCLGLQNGKSDKSSLDYSMHLGMKLNIAVT